MSYQIALDGPAGAGKSTIAKLIAKKMNYIYVDTGAMYRAIALYYLEEGISADRQDLISASVDKIDVTITYENGSQLVWLNGRDVSGLIRTEEVSSMASKTSVNPDVRRKLVELQRVLASRQNVVMDGRDIGTVVLHDANVKVYLTASSAVRAERRYDEQRAKGIECDLTEIEQDIIERDRRDMNREISPLRQAPDATLVDTSNMTIEEAAAAVIALCPAM